MERIFAVLLFSLFMLSSALAASNDSVIDLADWQPGQLLAGKAERYISEDPTLDLARIQATALPWQPLTTHNIDLGFTTANLWLRFRLHNSSPQPIHWTIAQDYSFIQQMDIYIQSESQLTEHQLRRDTPLTQRDWYYPRLNSRHHIKAGETQQIWIRLSNDHIEHLNGNVRLWQDAQFEHFLVRDASLLFPMIGIVLGTIMIWGCLGVVTRMQRLIGYIGFLATFLLTFCRYSGYDPVYFLGPQWRWVPEFQILAMVPLATLVIIMRDTTGLHRLYPRVDRAFKGLQWFLLGLFVAAATVLPPAVTNPLSAVMLALACMTLMPVTVWLACKRQRSYVTLFAIGQVCLLATPAVVSLFALTGLANNPLTVYPAVLLGLLIDSLMLSLSLAYWLKARNRAHQLAEKAARTDALTGLNNRLALELDIRTRLERPGRCYFALLDIDYFKQINDQWGHDAGDEVLRHLAFMLKDMQHSGDIVGRLGGEEFVLFMERENDEQAHGQLQRLRQRFADYQTPYEGILIEHSLSIGVTHREHPHSDFQTLYTEADRALYRAKAAGRNQLVISTGSESDALALAR